MTSFSRLTMLAALALAIAVVQAPSASAQQQIVPTCPQNSSWTGTECRCDAGYQSVEGNRCVSVSEVCGEHATLSGARCVCEAGYLQYRDECLTPDAFCAKTGAAYDAALGSCVCPPNTARNLLTRSCEPLLGATLRARLTLSADPLAEVTVALVSTASRESFTKALFSVAAQPDEVEDSVETLKGVLDVSSSELVVTASLPALDELRKEIAQLPTDSVVAAKDLVLVSDTGPVPTTDLSLLKVQRSLAASQLLLSQQTSDLNAVREEEATLLTKTTTVTEAEATKLLADTATVTRQIEETKTTLTTLEGEKSTLLSTSTATLSTTTTSLISPTLSTTTLSTDLLRVSTISPTLSTTLRR